MKDKNDNNFMILVAFNLFLLIVGLLLFVLAAVVTTAQVPSTRARWWA